MINLYCIRKHKYYILIIGLTVIISCTYNEKVSLVEPHYDTVSAINTMLLEPELKSLWDNKRAKEKYNDSIYIIKRHVSDSVLYRLKLGDKKIGFLPAEKSPYITYDTITTKRIMSMRILSIDSVSASGSILITGYNQIFDINLKKENNKWIIKSKSISMF